MKNIFCVPSILTVVLFIMVEIGFAQSDTLWTKVIGGSFRDVGESVQQTSDGGYIIGGITCTSDLSPMYVFLVKTDSLGNQLWSKTFNSSRHHWSSSVQQTTDGGYLIGAGGEDAWLIKTNASGEEEWIKTFGGSGHDYGISAVQTSDGGYVLTGGTCPYPVGSGSSDSDVWLIRTDSSGSLIWTKTFGGSNFEHGTSIRQTFDGGYIVAGRTSSYGAGETDIYLIKTDSAGNEEWTRTFGGKGMEWAHSVQQTQDSCYIIVGGTASYGQGAYDVWLIKTDANGNSIWGKTFGGGFWDMGKSVIQSRDGAYIIAGETKSYRSGNQDVWIIKTDSSGEKIWDRTFGGSFDDGANAIYQTNDGGYIITGFLSYSKDYHDRDLWLIRLAQEEVVSIQESKKNSFNFYLKPNFPNPFNNITTISFQLSKKSVVNLSVYNVSGQFVTTLVDKQFQAGLHSMQWNTNRIGSGIYFYRIIVSDHLNSDTIMFSATGKCVLLK
jgi:hypothetical protein